MNRSGISQRKERRSTSSCITGRLRELNRIKGDYVFAGWQTAPSSWFSPCCCCFSWVVQVLGEMSSGSSCCHNPEGTCMTSCLIRCGIHGNWGSGMSCTASHLITLLANSEAAGLVAHIEHVSCVQNNTSHHKHATKPRFSENPPGFELRMWLHVVAPVCLSVISTH